MAAHDIEEVSVVKYTVVYETIAGPGSVIDGTVIEDLRGWPAPHSFDLPARDDAEAVRLMKEWYSKVDSELSAQRRYMVGEPRILKTTTLDWKD